MIAQIFLNSLKVQVFFVVETRSDDAAHLTKGTTAVPVSELATEADI